MPQHLPPQYGLRIIYANIHPLEYAILLLHLFFKEIKYRLDYSDQPLHE